MAEAETEKSLPANAVPEENVKKKKVVSTDPEFFSCMLQSSPADSDPNYIGIRRLLLYRKAESGVLRRKDWRCNGKGYVAYRNFINRPGNWETSQIPSRPSTPGNSGRWLSPNRLSHLFDLDSWSFNRDRASIAQSQTLSRTTSLSSNASDSDRSRTRKKSEPAYSFVGMHCIFDKCQAMVTVIKFGHMSSDLLAYGASDGSLTVCTVSMPPSILKQLTGHTKDVTDFDFSANDQYIASSSMDKTVRVWDISQGLCIRVIYGVSSQLCIRFHPVNNNFLSAGNSKKETNVFNFSTGRTISKTVFDGEVTAMDHDHTGQLIFCGDGQGCLYAVSMDSCTGYNRSIQHIFSAGTWPRVTFFFNLDGNLSFYSVSLEVKGYLTPGVAHLNCPHECTASVHLSAPYCSLKRENTL